MEFLTTDHTFNKYIEFLIKNEIKSIDTLLYLERQSAIKASTMLKDFSLTHMVYETDKLWDFIFRNIEFNHEMELLTLLSYHRDETLFGDILYSPNNLNPFDSIYHDLLNLSLTQTKLTKDSNVHLSCFNHNEVRSLYLNDYLLTRA